MRIKYIPTGNIFDLPQEEIQRIMSEDRGNNYEDLDGAFKPVKKEVEETTLYNEIVEDDGTGETEEKEKPLADLTNKELKAKLDEMGITYPKNAKKDELLALFKYDGTTEGE